MAIEIREVLIRATVTKNGRKEAQDVVTHKDIRKIREMIVRDCMEQVKDYLEEERLSR